MADELRPGMVQCEVTGKWLPEDEVVTIQGVRVGAEGTQILLDKLKSGAALPGEMETPGAGRRFGAMFLDNLMLTVATTPLKLLIAMVLVTGASQSGNNTAGAAIDGLAGLITIGMAFAYFTLMHAKSGQTVGKKAAKLKVVRLDGKPIDLRTSVIRTAVYQGPGLVGAVMVSLAISPGLSAVALVGGVISILSLVYLLVTAIMALVDKSKQQAIHDRVAGTRVIRLSM